jgi:hypothetical protein
VLYHRTCWDFYAWIDFIKYTLLLKVNWINNKSPVFWAILQQSYKDNKWVPRNTNTNPCICGEPMHLMFLPGCIVREDSLRHWTIVMAQILATGNQAMACVILNLSESKLIIPLYNFIKHALKYVFYFHKDYMVPGQLR